MSNDFYRPTYTMPDDVHDAYNATQVRLYGIRGPSYSAQRGDGKGDEEKGVDVVTGLWDDKFVWALIGRDRTGATNSADIVNAMKKGFGNNVSPTDSSFVFITSVMKNYMIMLSAIDLGGDRELSAGVIFGYSYEGHCYDLPKPKIMLIPTLPQRIPDDDCGYDEKRAEGYKVWIVDKLDQCVELEVSQGFIEQLVLEANLPGKRSPNMYAGKMMLGHRGGRLTE